MPAASKPDALPTVDDARKHNWRGGDLVETLVKLVKDPEPTLAAPFLAY
jgi:hypothetical protein